ncbi:MAG: bifunctional GNAT family N-acetyltransferase/acetate--CoA ligase family protein [Dehalococcoidia bacterium]|jgi:acetyltransferase
MIPEEERNYPAHYETEVVLKDGSRILLRPIKTDDTERWLAFIQQLSDRTKYLRFHHVPEAMNIDDAIRYCTVDYVDTFAFVAEVIRERQKDIVAIGRYYRLPDKQSAEVAFVIDDIYQGKGIGTKLMEWLANVARENDITTFKAGVLAENDQMMEVFLDYGFHITSDLSEGEYYISFPIARTKRVARKEEERELISTMASLRSVLAPRSVAVIGASRNEGTLGKLVLQSLLKGRFSGVVYPVNPNTDVIMSIKTYPSVLDIPGPVDLAVILVPAPLVARVTDECGRKGVRAVIVISDGFKERGEEGAARERELRDIALGHGMRVVGPNCMGVINTDPAVNMNATFSRIYPPQGNVAFLSQSGAMGLVILEYAGNVNMGISTFVSVGNRVDISANDLLQYWGQDPATKVILLYLESFGSPRRFSRLARKVSATKPILAVKSGSTPAGSRAAMSHTGALATPEIVSDALFREAGIIRVHSVSELFDVATLLSNQPAPKGRRLAIVTSGGGPGIIAADSCLQHGLELPDLSKETVETLKPLVRPGIPLHNPIDLTAGADSQDFENVLKVLAQDKGFDAVLTIFIPPTIVEPEATENAIRQVIPTYHRHRKTLVSCFMGQRGVRGKLGVRGRFVPSYRFPDDAISALAKAVEYEELRRKPKGKVPAFKGIKRERAHQLVEKVLTGSTTRPLWLSPEQITELLGCYGIRTTQTLTAAGADEAAEMAAKLGFPVVVKLNSPTISHKTDVGGVILDLKSKADVKKAFHTIEESLEKIGRRKEMTGVTVQPMIGSGVEALIGITQDPNFGPLIMFGLGGIYAELFKDVALKLHPLTDVDARELVGSIKTAKVLQGYRGAPSSDTKALEELLLRVSAMVEDIPQIAELDLNPVKVMPQGEGYWVVDARVTVK